MSRTRRITNQPFADQKTTVTLTNGNDTYFASDAGETIRALAGNDFVIGGDGDDVINGNLGNDSIGGRRGNDAIYGGEGDDSITGEGGRNLLDGGDGDDYLQGGVKADTFHGGLGVDQFDLGSFRHVSAPDNARDVVVYTSVDEAPLSNGNADGLVNFVHTQDRIDLSAIDADAATPENDAFTFIKDAAFSGTPGELRVVSYDAQGSFYIVTADVNGDTVADMSIYVDSNGEMLGHRDFVL